MRRGTQGLNKNSNQNSSGVQKFKLAQQQIPQVKLNTIKIPAAQLMPQSQIQPTFIIINSLQQKNKNQIQNQQNNLVLQSNKQVLKKGANQISKQPQKQQAQNKKTPQQLLNQNMILKYEKLAKQFNTVKLLYLRKLLSKKKAKNKTALLFSKFPLLMSKYEIFPNFGIADKPNKWNLKPGQQLSLFLEEGLHLEGLNSY